jgi:hypothetical protein
LTSAQYDLTYLEACIIALKDFLLANDLYWPVGVNPPAGEPPFPQLTIGGLLLSRERAKGRHLILEQELLLAKLLQNLHAVISDWRVAWSSKAAREYRMRLNMWRNFIEEYRKDPEGNADRYPFEARLRVMLHLLQAEADKLDSAELEMLAGLDKVLRTVFVTGEFVWDVDVMDGFPQEVYWYLFGKLPEELS